ncbi:hypothetical protein [Bradyrhizobium sp. SZCCHNPS2010]|uniref:hypothetical protein n=1 Tax=Bradyrhizobium sp. SZCCHNPS2010 TaxID=3057333 RepID=UPI002915DAE2|nr:hypothetical protein [Bradyrhizobium sp. SZCCHNPS2010]
MTDAKPLSGGKPETDWGAALKAEGEDREVQLKKASTDLRIEMEQLADQLRELVLVQPPQELLGYLWSQFTLAAIRGAQKLTSEYINQINKFQFVLEYVHAVWCSHSGEFAKDGFDQTKAESLQAKCEKLSMTAMFYAMASSQLGQPSEFGEVSKDIEFQAKSAWVMIRGHRYQVLEEEFFQFVLAPHEAALQDAYSIGANDIAKGIQSIADSFRSGYGDAIEKMRERWTACLNVMKSEGRSMEAAVEKIRAVSPDFTMDMEAVFLDLFRGGICNLSAHTRLPEPLLQDLSYEPGAETEFFAPGEYCGTPYRTLPARIKPVVHLSDGYYATDGQFVRDSAYRAIQRGVIARKPEYREGWNKNQKELIEGAFQAIFSNQLKGAEFFKEVYFKDPITGEWVETDLVGILDDTLFNVEAKAGVMAMHSPATNFDRHVRTIRELVVKAYRQCKRFIDYLASGDEMPIYRLDNGKYEEARKLRLREFRRVLPIGLTVESFTPFSSMCKQIPELAPIAGKFPFVSMSVDDLFVLNRFLPTTGELFHYLEVRQAVAGIPKAMVFDEIDHLGAYIKRNRFDQDMKEQLETADMATWDGFSEAIDEYFTGDDWQSKPVPTQDYPAEIEEIFGALDRSRPKGWLEIDAYLRNSGSEFRDSIAPVLRDMKASLKKHQVRRFLFGNDEPIQIYFTKEMGQPSVRELQHHGEVACLIAKIANIRVVILDCDASGRVVGARTARVKAPPIIRTDYPQLAAEADRLKSRSLLGAKGKEEKK